MRQRSWVPNRALGLWLVCVLLAACGRTPTPTLTPTATRPSPTATPAPTATPPPTPEGAAQAYLSAWQQGDYAAMYALLAPESQAALSAPDFEKSYRDNLTIMSAVTVTPTLASMSETGDSAEARAHLAYTTLLVGTLETDITLPLKRNGGRWGVIYSPALIWPDLANGQKLYMVYFTPGRGSIYDRNGVPMAKYEEAYAIGLVPGEIQDEVTVQDGLARLLHVTRNKIFSLYQYAVPDQYLPVAEVGADQVGRRFLYLTDVPGVVMQPYTSRFYYGGGDGAHVTGYLSFITQEELAAYQAKGYAGNERVGRAGLEAWGEARLAGRNGGQLTLLDAAGKPLRAIASGPSLPAQDIYSTVDFDFQKAVQFALGDMLGAAVVLDVHTGAVLAMASNPTYDPNLFDPNNRNAVALPQIFSDQRRPLINRAAQSAYPVGSVFKVVTMSAGLTSGLFTPETEYTCSGEWNEVALATPLTDWKEGGHGTITLKEGLAGSCNPYFWHVGYALYTFNPSWLSDTAQAFGLGQATGIGQVEETPGQIPDPTWKQQTKGEAWEPLDSLNLAIGQGDVLVTPLQIARMMAAIGNGGTLYQPQLVLRSQPPDGPPTFELAPIPLGQLPLKPDQLQALQEAMHNVTQEPLGTARNRFRGLPKWLKIAGKTGTAEDAGIYGTREPDAWFAGYTFANRADLPDIAIAVVVENQGQGSEFAAPVFRRIVESYFGIPLTRYPWESAIGVVATPEPTPTEGAPAETETPAPQP